MIFLLFTLDSDDPIRTWAQRQLPIVIRAVANKDSLRAARDTELNRVLLAFPIKCELRSCANVSSDRPHRPKNGGEPNQVSPVPPPRKYLLLVRTTRVPCPCRPNVQTPSAVTMAGFGKRADISALRGLIVFPIAPTPNEVDAPLYPALPPIERPAPVGDCRPQSTWSR